MYGYYPPVRVINFFTDGDNHEVGINVIIQSYFGKRSGNWVDDMCLNFDVAAASVMLTYRPNLECQNRT